jgi:acetolactate synthase I/II/III large subunit
MAEASAKSGVPIHPMRLISELQKILTPDVTVCSDMGTVSMYLCRYLFSFRARQFLITNGQQTLGGRDALGHRCLARTPAGKGALDLG